MRTLVMVTALVFASPAMGQSSCDRPNILCLQVQRTDTGASDEGRAVHASCAWSVSELILPTWLKPSAGRPRAAWWVSGS